MKTAFFQQKNIEVYRTAQNSTEAAIDMLYLCNGNEGKRAAKEAFLWWREIISTGHSDDLHG
jgi:hypothetical protein